MNISIVIPVHNEADNIAQLFSEIRDQINDRHDFELIFVDDGSTDNSISILEDLAQKSQRLRFVRHRKRYGQSAAIFTGISNAINPVIVTIDGDGQNDPADINRLLRIYESLGGQSSRSMITGFRRIRYDSAWKKISSRLANIIRGSLLKDETPDTGCGLKVFGKDLFFSLPAFDHMHRFLPALVKRARGKVISVEVNHRPRRSGISHYGTLDRLVTGMIDTFGVFWLLRRPMHPETERTGFRDED